MRYAGKIDAVVLGEMLAPLATGRRQETIEVLESALRRRRGDAGLLHALGLASLWTAQSLEQNNLLDRAAPYWERAIASLSVLLSDEAFWVSWREQAEDRYKAEVPTNDLADMRADLTEHLVLTFSADARLSPPNPGSRRDILFRWELNAVEALREFTAGWSTEGPPAPMVGGPLLLRLLQCEGQFAAWMAEAGSANLGVRRHVSLVRLRRLFSPLGLAQTHLDLDQPEQALPALALGACPQCLRRSEGKAAVPSKESTSDNIATSPPNRRVDLVTCAQDCPEFDLWNPGYAHLADRGERLESEALALAADIHLSLAERAITVTPMDLDTATRHWENALAVVAGPETEAVQSCVVTLVLGRARTLESKRVDEAIALLEHAKRFIDHPEFPGRLAELHAGKASAAAKATPPRWDQAAADFGRALAIQPAALTYRMNRCISLTNQSTHLRESGQEFESLRFLKEAMDCAREVSPGSGRPRELDDLLTRCRAEWLERLHESAVSLARAQKLAEARELLEAGAQECPQNAQLQDSLKQVRKLQELSGNG